MKTYTAGELAKLAGVTSRTIRYYDQRGLLLPAGHSESGYRLYDDSALVKMQQIVMLKFAGFSLEEIRNLLLMGQGQDIRETLEDQRQLLVQRIGQLEEIVTLLEDMAEEDTADMERLAESMRLTRRVNHSARTYHAIKAHSQRPLYPWEFEQLGLTAGSRVLDVGCGIGMIWRHSWEQIPENTEITMLDVHPKCIRETKRYYEEQKEQLRAGVKFHWRQENAETAGFSGQYDQILMAYLWHYLKDWTGVLRKLHGALAAGGTLNVIQGTASTLHGLDAIWRAYVGQSCLQNRMEREAERVLQIEQTLKAEFSQVEAIPFENELHFTRTLDLYQYMMDSYQELVQEMEKQGTKFVNFLRKYVEEQGTVTLKSKVMLWRCKKEESR